MIGCVAVSSVRYNRLRPASAGYSDLSGTRFRMPLILYSALRDERFVGSLWLIKAEEIVYTVYGH